MSDANEALRIAARDLLNERVAMATGRHNPAAEARAWDRFALAIDVAEDAAFALADHLTTTEGAGEVGSDG